MVCIRAPSTSLVFTAINPHIPLQFHLLKQYTTSNLPVLISLNILINPDLHLTPFHQSVNPNHQKYPCSGTELRGHVCPTYQYSCCSNNEFLQPPLFYSFSDFWVFSMVKTGFTPLVAGLPSSITLKRNWSNVYEDFSGYASNCMLIEPDCIQKGCREHIFVDRNNEKGTSNGDGLGHMQLSSFFKFGEITTIKRARIGIWCKDPDMGDYLEKNWNSVQMNVLEDTYDESNSKTINTWSPAVDRMFEQTQLNQHTLLERLGNTGSIATNVKIMKAYSFEKKTKMSIERHINRHLIKEI